MKTCGKCNRNRRDTSFHRRRGGLQHYCKKCNNDYRKEHRKTNETYRRNNIRATKIARDLLVEEVNILKSKTPCHDCGENYNSWQMQFDHVDDNKIENVSNLARRGSREEVLAEIAKCELVCANCHADRTHYRSEETKTLPSGVVGNTERSERFVLGSNPSSVVNDGEAK